MNNIREIVCFLLQLPDDLALFKTKFSYLMGRLPNSEVMPEVIPKSIMLLKKVALSKHGL